LRYTQQNNTALAKFSLAVDTGIGENKKANFFNMTAWGKTAETLSKHTSKGTKLLLECEATQNQYKDKNGNNINTVDFRVLNFEFCESKGNQQNNNTQSAPQAIGDGFMNISDGIDDELPFN
jgi:single-strand DNA-binding protein